jgi:hypothetical protein
MDQNVVNNHNKSDFKHPRTVSNIVVTWKYPPESYLIQFLQ